MSNGHCTRFGSHRAIARRAGGAAVVVLVLAACALPGSALTQVGVAGRVIDADGVPVVGERIDVMLPAGYGLAGFDRVMGAPADYGHHPMSANVVTDGDGRFSYRFPQTTYSVTFLLIPPLGSFPRKAPQPVVAVRTAGISPDWWLVRPTDETVECRRFEDATKSVLKAPDEHVTGSAAFIEPSDSEKETQGSEGWRFELTLRRP